MHNKKDGGDWPAQFNGLHLRNYRSFSSHFPSIDR